MSDSKRSGAGFGTMSDLAWYINSDQGRQYTTGRYQALLAQHKILPSMSRVGECGENAGAEASY